MNTAGGRGTAMDASVEVGPPAEVKNSWLADALAELEAAEKRVAKLEAHLEVARASYDAAKTAVEALQRKGE